MSAHQRLQGSVQKISRKFFQAIRRMVNPKTKKSMAAKDYRRVGSIH